MVFFLSEKTVTPTNDNSSIACTAYLINPSGIGRYFEIKNNANAKPI